MKNRFRNCGHLFLRVVLVSLAAGFVNGLFGTGGGILIVLFLSHIYAGDPVYQTKDRFAMTVGAIAICSLASTFLYWRRGAFTFADASPFLIPAAIGGLLGAFLLDRLDAALFKKLFALLVIYAGGTLLFR